MFFFKDRHSYPEHPKWQGRSYAYNSDRQRDTKPYEKYQGRREETRRIDETVPKTSSDQKKPDGTGGWETQDRQSGRETKRA